MTTDFCECCFRSQTCFPSANGDLHLTDDSQIKLLRCVAGIEKLWSLSVNRLGREVVEASRCQKTWKGSECFVAEKNEERQTEFCVGLTCDCYYKCTFQI